MNLVFDSSALLAYFKNEPGADLVRNLLRDPGNRTWVHAVNLCEVYYDLVRVSNEEQASTKVAALQARGLVPREDMDASFWQQAGHYKADLRRVSLADCFCLTLANRESASIVTADHHEFDRIHTLGLGKITFIR